MPSRPGLPKRCRGDVAGWEVEEFMGKEFDEEGSVGELGIEGMGLYHFTLRNYDPELGIWLRAEPFGQYFNGYSYTGGNPVNRVDPSGGADSDQEG